MAAPKTEWDREKSHNEESLCQINGFISVWLWPRIKLPVKKARRERATKKTATAYTKNHVKFEPREISWKIFVNLHENACFITCFTWYQAYVQHFIWFYSDKLAHWWRGKKTRTLPLLFEMTHFFINFLTVFPMIVHHCHNNSTWNVCRLLSGIQAHNFTMLQRIQSTMSLILYVILWDIRKHASHNASFVQLSGLRRKYRNEYGIEQK